jgi:hypothetical protein
MNDWIRRLSGVNYAAIRRVEATTARIFTHCSNILYLAVGDETDMPNLAAHLG